MKTIHDRTERLFNLTRKTDTCWLWIGCKNNKGYGLIHSHRINIGTRDEKPVNVQVHRLSWTIHKGEIPEGLQVLHKCDIRNCINPEHLFLGTNIDNVNDRKSKGRPVGPGFKNYTGCSRGHSYYETGYFLNKKGIKICAKCYPNHYKNNRLFLKKETTV